LSVNPVIRISSKFILAFEEIGFELGLFFWGLRRFHFHNSFVKKRLRSFLQSAYGGQDWVCFA